MRAWCVVGQGNIEGFDTDAVFRCQLAKVNSVHCYRHMC